MVVLVQAKLGVDVSEFELGNVSLLTKTAQPLNQLSRAEPRGKHTEGGDQVMAD